MKHKYTTRRSLLALIVVLVIIVAGTWMLTGSKNQHSVLTYPAYLNYNAKFVFSVPSSFTVDSRALPGIEVVHKGSLTAKTYDDLYNAGDITLEPISTMKDQAGKTFKNYVNDTFVPSLKKKYPSSLVKLKFEKVDGWDVARVIVTQAGKSQRFVYLKNGQHPVAIASKEENAAAKTINKSIIDIESSPLKDEITPLKQAFQDNVKLIIDKNSAQLYKQAAPDLRAKSTEAQLAKILQDASAYYTSSGISIYDGIYNGNTKEFNAIANYLPLKTSDPSIPVALYLAKVDGQWKVKGISILAATTQ